MLGIIRRNNQYNHDLNIPKSLSDRKITPDFAKKKVTFEQLVGYNPADYFEDEELLKMDLSRD